MRAAANKYAGRFLRAWRRFDNAMIKVLMAGIKL
jgi:hypothetical protein